MSLKWYENHLPLPSTLLCSGRQQFSKQVVVAIHTLKNVVLFNIWLTWTHKFGIDFKVNNFIKV